MIESFFLEQAYAHAALHSTDPRTQNGAVLVKDNYPILYAANHFPAGVQNIPSRWVQPLKYEYVEHAERNLIYAAAKAGIATAGCTMYCPWFACADCARAIIQSGIICVVGHDNPLHKKAIHWIDKVARADEMLTEAGVMIVRIKANFPKIRIRFDGEIITL